MFISNMSDIPIKLQTVYGGGPLQTACFLTFSMGWGSEMKIYCIGNREEMKKILLEYLEYGHVYE